MKLFNTGLSFLLACWLGLWLIPETCLGGQGQATGRDTVSVQLPDLDLNDQEGRTVSFRRDIIGDRVAVVIPFYTTCTSAYPILVFVFTKLQHMLGERLGRDVVLVSVTVDPRTDIPIRLKAFARRQKALDGWVFLTGERDHLAEVLLGVRILLSDNLEGHNHTPVTMLGRAGEQWRRYQGFPTPEQLLEQIEKYLATRPSAQTGRRP